MWNKIYYHSFIPDLNIYRLDLMERKFRLENAWILLFQDILKKKTKEHSFENKFEMDLTSNDCFFDLE